MTGQHDPTETLLEKTLAGQAEHAPSDGDLLTQVHGRLRRRRTSRNAAAAVVVACAAVAGGILGVNSLQSKDPQGAAILGETWRWESYRNVQVQVPADWGYGAGVDYPACLITTRQEPAVSRPPFIVPAIACGPEPVELPYRAASLTFGSSRDPGVVRQDHGWVVETRLIAGVRITAYSNDDALRARILDSARVIDGADGNGCRVDHPSAHAPEQRPVSNGGLNTVGTVESISVCRYTAGDAARNLDSPLLASSQLTGEPARDLVNAIITAPDGSGPNDPQTCLDQYGDELLVLNVHGSDHDQEVVVRYSGCNHHGTDDGTERRQLTAIVARTLLTGPHQLSAYSGSIGALLNPPPSK